MQLALFGMKVVFDRIRLFRGFLYRCLSCISRRSGKCYSVPVFNAHSIRLNQNVPFVWLPMALENPEVLLWGWYRRDVTFRRYRVISESFPSWGRWWFRIRCNWIRHMREFQRLLLRVYSQIELKGGQKIDQHPRWPWYAKYGENYHFLSELRSADTTIIEKQRPQIKKWK